MFVPWKVKAVHFAPKSSQVWGIARVLFNDTHFMVVLECQVTSILPVNHTDCHTWHLSAHSWLVGHSQDMFIHFCSLPFSYMFTMWKTVHKICSQLTPSLYPYPFAMWLTIFSHWEVKSIPYLWILAGFGACFEPPWLIEEAQVVCWMRAQLSLCLRQPFANPQRQSCRLTCSWPMKELSRAQTCRTYEGARQGPA